MSTIKTILHTYYFLTDKQQGRDEWAAFQAARTAEGSRVFATHGGGMSNAEVRACRTALEKLNGKEVELETAHVFNNQWNTAPTSGNLRVFDWKQDIWPNAHVQSGHYLVQTDEMREVRRNTMACGYCGRQEPAAKGYVFCPHCLDNEYLAEKDLPLTRMVCARDSFGANRAPLTEAEAAHLLPLYREAQIHGSTERGKARLAKARADVKKEFNIAAAQAVEKRDAATWILDNVPGLHANWLFYTHTGRHSFGWREPLGAEVVSALLDKISEFHFAYDIHCEDGRTLSGG